MPKNYLVTGGSGFLGASLVSSLVTSGHNVRVLDNNSRGHLRRLAHISSDIDFVHGDIRDLQTTLAASKNIDCICHLAYVNGTEYFYSRPELVLDVAVRGMLNIADACRQLDIGHLVLASSSEVYQTPPVFPTPEDVPLVVPDVSNPRYSYGGGKILCELMALNSVSNASHRVSIFRPHNVYGPDMGWEHVIPQFALRANELISHDSTQLQFAIKGDGTQTRSFVYISDFTEGLLHVINHGEHKSIYNIGTSEEVSIADLARQVVEYFGCEAQIVSSSAPSGETNRRCPDITKLINLGYRPRIKLAEGLRSTIDWYVNNTHLKPSITNSPFS